MRKPRRLTRDELAPFSWELPLELQGSWGDRTALDPDAVAAIMPIDWGTMFGNANPVEIEVGFGKGLFLINQGITHPETNFFGIEIIRKYQLYAATRITNRAMPNVRTCCGDAKLVMSRFVVPKSVTKVHVFFPDPWWKNKHKKRTLFTPEFAELVHRVLIPGGVLHFVTDVADYFAMVMETITASTLYSELAAPAESEPTHDMDYLTNFERKFRREGRPIYRSQFSTR